MPSDGPAFDLGVLSPVTAGHDASVADGMLVDDLVRAEAALLDAYADVGVIPRDIAERFARTQGLTGGDGHPSRRMDIAALAVAAASGGNPVIPLVRGLRASVPDDVAAWVHRGPTSQDILDTALMLTAQRAVGQVRASLLDAADALRAQAAVHRDDVAAARTLTQHAVPTTVGLRLATWARGLGRAAARLGTLRFPAQLGGAAGTLASFALVTGSVDRARDVADAYARRLGLQPCDAPWHVTRWPVTELGDALVAALDAMGKLAADVATLSRTEIGEVAEGAGGGSSTMPQKHNPAHAVLIRSAALRAPQLAATLHVAAALAVDERPDGAWHAEWPTLRDLLRLALGASWHAASLSAHLVVNTDAAAANLARTRGLIVAERLSLVLGPRLGADAVKGIVAATADGADLASTVHAALDAAGITDVDVASLLDPASYTGLAGRLVDGVTADAAQPTRPQEET